MGRRLMVLLALTATLAGGVTLVAGPAGAHGGRGVGKSVLVRAAATYIGVSVADLRAAKRAGQTPAQLAVAHGKTVAGLTAALTAAATTRINQAAAAGRITSAQASAKLAALPEHVQRFVNSSGGCSGRG